MTATRDNAYRDVRNPNCNTIAITSQPHMLTANRYEDSEPDVGGSDEGEEEEPEGASESDEDEEEEEPKDTGTFTSLNFLL